MVEPEGGLLYPCSVYSGTQPSSMLKTDSLMAASTTCTERHVLDPLLTQGCRRSQNASLSSEDRACCASRHKPIL